MLYCTDFLMDIHILTALDSNIPIHLSWLLNNIPLPHDLRYFYKYLSIFRYIPNISKALFTVLQKMEAKRLLATTTTNNSNSSTSNSSKNSNSSNGTNDTQNVLAQLRLKTLTETTLSEHLHKAVDKYEADSLVQSTLERTHTDSGSGKRRKLFLMPSARVFKYPLPVPNNSSNGNGDGEDAINLTATPDKDGADFPDSDALLTQDSHLTSTSTSASGRKRNLSQLSRANTADTVNTYVNTSSTSKDTHRWISLTLLSTGASSSGKSSAAEGTQLSQADAVPMVGGSASSINGYILV